MSILTSYVYLLPLACMSTTYSFMSLSTLNPYPLICLPPNPLYVFPLLPCMSAPYPLVCLHPTPLYVYPLPTCMSNTYHSVCLPFTNLSPCMSTLYPNVCQPLTLVRILNTLNLLFVYSLTTPIKSTPISLPITPLYSCMSTLTFPLIKLYVCLS